MLQRIQTVWLLLTTAFTASTFRFPVYSGGRIEEGPVMEDGLSSTMAAVSDLNATTTLWITVLTVLTGVVAFVTIFLFDNRKLQLKLCYLGIFLTVILFVMYFMEVANYNSGNVAIWAIFYFAILICFILAARGIYKDQQLIKSMDRLR